MASYKAITVMNNIIYSLLLTWWWCHQSHTVHGYAISNVSSTQVLHFDYTWYSDQSRIL